jgi:capsular polysaccharide biosynthesis protein
MPTVRSQIPPTPIITIFEICLYGIMSTTILCLLRSYIDNFAEEGYNYDWETDPCFIISLVIVVLVGLVMIVGFLMFKCYLEKSYNAEIKEIPLLDTDLPNPE